jgi:very-short-patch-repair endonuclease
MTELHNYNNLKQIRRELRKNATPQEYILWQYLKKSKIGFKFRRQHSIGYFIVDFYCPEKRLIVELKGAPHMKMEKKENDKERSDILKSLGYNMVEFWNSEVEKDIDMVIKTIKHFLTTP